jgi:DNA-directed RNA polymerase specialized sigma24 family protein
MPQPIDFLDLIRQIRSGDQAASAELVRRFEPFIQRAVRIRLRQRGDHDRLRRDVGSSDVCQSVLRSLFQGLKENRYQLDQPGDLERLLHVMVRFNVASKARRSSVRLRELLDDFEEQEWTDHSPGPHEEVDLHDLIEAIQDQFSGEELEILTPWLGGESWESIGHKTGTTADAARVRLTRAVHRVRNKMTADGQTGSQVMRQKREKTHARREGSKPDSGQSPTP